MVAMNLGNALAAYQQALKLEGQAQVNAIMTAAEDMAEAIEARILSDAMKAMGK
jgi:hypothetical protein